MNQFSEMEWNTKWDWENFVAFGAKETESLKKLQLADWIAVDDGEIDAGSFNLSGGGGNSGASGSDCGNGSSAKSSISASTDSSSKDGVQTPNFRFMTFDPSGNFTDKIEMKGTRVSGTSPAKEASVGSMEPLIGLGLGKRTYFENGGSGGNVKSTSLSVIPASSTMQPKKTKSSSQSSVIPRCQVEGCNTDLSMAKEYHRKHRVCDTHSKCPKVIIGGLERRFCQQCSRFHGLNEFDEKKRSCRRRLSDHNARRRKPQQETIHFNSTRLSSSFYGGRQQMSILLNNAPLIHSRNPANSAWDSTCNSKFTLTKGDSLKSDGVGDNDELLQVPGIKLSHVINIHGSTVNGFLTSKSSTTEMMNPGSKEFPVPSHLDAAPEDSRALSLLSNRSWGSCGPESIPSHYPMQGNNTIITQPAIPQGVPLSSSELWLSGPHSAHPRVQPLATNNSFQEIQLFKVPYEAEFYSNMLN